MATDAGTSTFTVEPVPVPLEWYGFGGPEEILDGGASDFELDTSGMDGPGERGRSSFKLTQTGHLDGADVGRSTVRLLTLGSVPVQSGVSRLTLRTSGHSHTSTPIQAGASGVRLTTRGAGAAVGPDIITTFPDCCTISGRRVPVGYQT